MRSVLRGPAHQLAVRMRINNCTHGQRGIVIGAPLSETAVNAVGVRP